MELCVMALAARCNIDDHNGGHFLPETMHVDLGGIWCALVL